MSLPSFSGTSAPRRGVAGVVVIALVAVLAPAARAAEQVTVAPSADTFVAAAEPIYNYGGAGSVAVSGAGAGDEFQGLLRFDLAAAKAGFDAAYGAGGWKLDSASLRLTTSNPNNPVFNANAAGPVSVRWMQNDAWVEGTGGPTTPTTDGVTFATLPTYLSAADETAGTINFPGGTTGTNTYTLTPSAGFINDVLTGGSLSLRLSVEANAATSYLFSSRTFSQTTNRPMMTLTASPVPEPAAGMTLVAMTAMLLARRKRKC